MLCLWMLAMLGCWADIGYRSQANGLLTLSKRPLKESAMRQLATIRWACCTSARTPASYTSDMSWPVTRETCWSKRLEPSLHITQNAMLGMFCLPARYSTLDVMVETSWMCGAGCLGCAALLLCGRARQLHAICAECCALMHTCRGIAPLQVCVPTPEGERVVLTFRETSPASQSSRRHCSP